MDKAFIKKYGTLLLLAAGAGIIFQLPYIRETFYVPIQNAMGLSNAQMGLLSSGYATMATLSYFIGGMIADKFSARKLLTFSFIATGALGLWFSTFPSFAIGRLIFVLMGITSIITYWSACIKATRMLGGEEEQGRLFGLQEGLRGILNAAVVFGMAWVFAQFTDEIAGASAAIKVCAIVDIIIGILNFIFIEDTKREEQSEPVGTVVKEMFKTLLLPRVWVLVAIVFTAYSVYGLVSYATTYAQQFFGMSAATAATLGGVRYLIQGVGGIVAGFAADKLSRGKVVIIGSIGMAVGAFAVAMCDSMAIKGVLPVLSIIVYAAFFMMSWGPICWVLISEIFPNTIRGKAVAIAVAFQWIFNYIVSSTFPALYDFSPMFAYSLYGIICVAAAIFVWRWVPETKGKTLEDMSKLWKKNK